MTEAFPLYWPEGRPRTQPYARKRSAFKTGFGAAVLFVIGELKRLGARDAVVSTNVPLRRDGLPMSTAKRPHDPGAAVYFTYKGKQMAFACDKWHVVEDNIYAIAKSIEAMRGIARWGTGDMVDAAFSGFTALPAPGAAKRPWRRVLNLPDNVSLPKVRIDDAYRALAAIRHPDRGGSHEAMSELNAARDEALREIGGA